MTCRFGLLSLDNATTLRCCRVLISVCFGAGQRTGDRRNVVINWPVNHSMALPGLAVYPLFILRAVCQPRSATATLPVYSCRSARPRFSNGVGSGASPAPTATSASHVVAGMLNDATADAALARLLGCRSVVLNHRAVGRTLSPYCTSLCFWLFWPSSGVKGLLRMRGGIRYCADLPCPWSMAAATGNAGVTVCVSGRSRILAQPLVTALYKVCQILDQVLLNLARPMG